MSAARYRNLISVQSNYVPEQYTPNFGAYAEILKQQQSAFDTMGALGEKVPQHLQQDYEDVTNYLGEVRNKIDSIADIYDKQGVSAGNRQRKSLLRDVSRDWQPGGKADRFQQRLNTYSAEKKRLEELYKDDPRIAQYYISKIGVSPYKDETAPNYGIQSPTTYKIYNDEELNNYYDKALGNISADQIVKTPYLDKSMLKGISFKDLLVEGKTKFIDWNKVAATLAGITTPQIQASEEVRGMAYGQGEGQSNIFKFDDQGNPVTDEQGRIQFADTALGRRLQGYTRGKAFTEQDMDLTQVDDVFGRQLALKREEQKMALQNVMLSQPYNFNVADTFFGGKYKGITIKDGKVVLTGSLKVREQKTRDYVDKYTNMLQAGAHPDALWIYLRDTAKSYFRQMFGKDDTIDLNSPQMQRTFNILEEQGFVETGATDEQKVRALDEAINYYSVNNTKQAQVTPLIGIDNASKNYINGLQQAMFGDQSGSSWGFLTNLKIYDDKGELVRPADVKKRVEKTGETAKLESEVRAPESLLPYGTRIFQVGDQEYRVEPMLSDKAEPDFIKNMVYRAKNDFMNNFEAEEELPGLKAGVNYGGLENFIQGPGKYKLEYNAGNGYNIYRKESTGYKKLNDQYLEF